MTEETYFKYELVSEVTPINDRCLKVVFRDGSRKILDCTRYIKQAYWKKLADPTFFRQVSVECGMLVWPGDIDIAPEEVWHNSTDV